MKRILVIAALLVLLLPAAANATIVVGRGMFGVTLGATMKHVRQKLGTPTATSHRNGIIVWTYSARRLKVGFNSRGVRDLYTTNPKQRTANGLGIGSTEQDVMRLVPGVGCFTTRGHPGTDCAVTLKRDGHQSGTDFHIAPTGLVDNVLVTRLS